MEKIKNNIGKYRYKAEVETLDGECALSHKVGDTFYFDGISTPKGMCGGAYWVLYPAICAMENCGAFNKDQGANRMSGLACPHNGNIKMKLTRLKD